MIQLKVEGSRRGLKDPTDQEKAFYLKNRQSESNEEFEIVVYPLCYRFVQKIKNEWFGVQNR